VLNYEYHAMSTYWEGVETEIHSFLTSALDGGEWSGSRTGRFTPGKINIGTHWIGGWLGPRVGLEAVVKRNNTSPCQV